MLNRVYRAKWALSKKIIIEVFHVLIALGIVLAYLYAISLFKPEYVILLRGVVWSRVYSIDLTYETLILLAVALAVSVCVYAIDGFRAVKLAKVSVYVLAILTVVCGLPLAYWIAYIWNPQFSQDHSLIRLSELDAGIFHIYAPAYPILLLTMLYAWLLLIIGRAFKGYARLKIRCSKTLNTAYECNPLDNVLMRRLGLISILLLSMILPIIPYLPSINPEFKPVSVDIRYYSNWLGKMLATDDWCTVEYVFHGINNGNRPLYLLMLYFLSSIGMPRDVVLNFEALLIAPLFALAIYYAAKRLSGNSQYAFLSSLAAVLGFNMTVGIMTGYFAMWAALTLFYLCVASTPGLECRSPRSLAIALMVSIMMLYVHPWTWVLLMSVLTVQLVISTVESLRWGKIKLDKYLLTVLIGNVLADIVKTSTSPSYGGLASSVSILGNGRLFGLEPLIGLPRSLQRLTVSYVAGLFYNPLHMLLAFIGMLSLLSRCNDTSRLIIIWVVLISLIFPFSDINLQSHLLFATPFPVLIAEGLWTLSKSLNGLDPKLPKLLTALFLSSSLTYAVRALCNLL